MSIYLNRMLILRLKLRAWQVPISRKFILIKKLYTHDISIFRWLQKSKALHVFMNSYQKYEKDGFSNDDSDKMFDVFQIHRVKWFLIEFMKLFGCRYLFQSMNLKCIKIDVRFIILMQRFRFSNSSWFLEFSSVILESWIRLFKYFFDYSIIRLLNYSILENWIIRTTDPYRQPFFTPRPHQHQPCAPCPSPSLSLGPLHLALTHTNPAPLALTHTPSTSSFILKIFQQAKELQKVIWSTTS
jgi:hypothetical protein